MLFFFIPPSYSLVLVSYPWSTFSADTVPFKRPSTSFHTKFQKHQRHKTSQKAWLEVRRTLFSKTMTQTSPAFVPKHTFLHGSLIRKSQQNSFELVTWLGEEGTMAYQAQSMGTATVAMEESRTRTPTKWHSHLPTLETTSQKISGRNRKQIFALLYSYFSNSTLMLLWEQLFDFVMNFSQFSPKKLEKLAKNARFLALFWLK